MDGNPLDTRPRSVALVALGPSYRSFVESRIHKKESQRYDEVWVVNSGAEVFKADKIWLMDDLKVMQHRYPAWGERLKSERAPIITCKVHAEYPTSVAYPIKEVINCVKDDWFTNTVSYAIGYAIYTQVEELFIFGADFMYPGSLVVEPGADCCAYLLGLATGRGVHWKLPQTTTLLDSHLTQVVDGDKMQRPLYGYDYNPGDCRSKVERGTATELEKVLARKAPHSVKEISHGPKLTVSPVDEGQAHRPDGGGESEPLRGSGGDERAQDHPAGGKSISAGWHCDPPGKPANVGVRTAGTNAAAAAEGYRVDGSDSAGEENQGFVVRGEQAGRPEPAPVTRN